MELNIAAIGKMRAGPLREMLDEYLKRARNPGRSIGFSAIAMREYEAPRSASDAERIKRESDFLLDDLGGSALIALDECGDDISSEEFSAMLAGLRDSGQRRCVFAIGGADGHDDAVRREARKVLAFGRATWPHMLVRVMLAEQIYRSMMIITGHPYHRS